MSNCISPTNTGGKGCLKNYGIIVGVILAPAGVEFTDEATAKLEASWTTKINAARQSRVYPLPKFSKFENAQDDPTFFEGDQERKFVRSGNIRIALTYISLDTCKQKMLKSFNGGDWYAWLVTNTGYILGKTEDGVKFQPFKVNFHADNQKLPASNNDPYMTKAFVDLTYPDDWSVKGMAVLPTAFDARELEGITDVTLATSAPSTGGVTVAVTTTCEGAQVSGLVAGDFVIKKAGVVQAITSLTEPNSDGVYVIVATLTAGAHTIELKGQPAGTTKGYESTASAAFTVS